MKKVLLLTAAVALAALSVAQGSIELRATLTGIGKGKATWKTRDAGNQLQGELEVGGERLLPNTLYRVVIGANIWSVSSNAFGAFKLYKRYVGPNRPSIGAGTIVRVKNGTGIVVLSGAFQ